MTDRNYGALRSAEKFEAFVKKLIDAGKPVGFDIEASYSAPQYIAKGALQQFQPSWFLTGFSFTNSTDWARYVPIAHADGRNADDVVRVAIALWKLLNEAHIVAHNLSYELKGVRRWMLDLVGQIEMVNSKVAKDILAKNGLFAPPKVDDSMILVFLSAEYEPATSELTQKELKGVTYMAFGHKMTTFDELFEGEDKKPEKDKRFHLLDSTDPKNINYACEDAVWALALRNKHHEDWGQTLIYRTEMALIPVLIEMEIPGLELDWRAIERREQEVAIFRDLMNEEIQQDLSDRLGRPISLNLGSTKQLAQILFAEEPEGLGLPVKVRSDKTQEPSTGDEALQAIAKVDPIIRKILDWRSVAKLYSSYLHKHRVELNYTGDNRVHPNHNQAGALTGRLSVDHFSYQQLPKPYHYKLSGGQTLDLSYRDLVVAPKGFRIVGFDFSQVELRIIAGLAHEEKMLEAFANGIDIHRATASAMYKIQLEDVTKDMRGKGKTGNFAVVYQSGAKSMAERMGTSVEEAQKMLDDYYAGFPALRNWMDARIAEGHEQGYVETHFGRKFTVWDFKDHRQWIRDKGDRMCINAPVQGSAADYLKIGMVRAQKAIKKAGMQDKIIMIMTIHDALEFYVADDISTQYVIDLITPQVSFPVKGLPEIRTDWHEGRRYGSVVEMDLDEHGKISGFHYEDEDGNEYHFDTLEDAYRHQDEHDLYPIQDYLPARPMIPDASDPSRFEEDDPHPLIQGTSGACAVCGKKRSRLHQLYKDIKAGNAPAPEHWTPKPRSTGGDKPVERAPIDPEFEKAANEAGLDVVTDVEGWMKTQQQANRRSLGGKQSSVEDLEAELAAEQDEEPPWLHAKPMALEEDESEPDRFIVRIEEMPYEDQWEKFEAFLAEHPGSSTLILSMPDGDVEFDEKYSISTDDQPTLSLIFNGATVMPGIAELAEDLA